MKENNFSFYGNLCTQVICKICTCLFIFVTAFKFNQIIVSFNILARSNNSIFFQAQPALLELLKLWLHPILTSLRYPQELSHTCTQVVITAIPFTLEHISPWISILDIYMNLFMQVCQPLIWTIWQCDLMENGTEWKCEFTLNFNCVWHCSLSQREVLFLLLLPYRVCRGSHLLKSSDNFWEKVGNVKKCKCWNSYILLMRM